MIDNGGSAFQLGVLSLKGKASATPGANLTMTISGDALNFSGATGTINLDASKYTSVTQNLTYNLNSNIQLGTATSASVLTLQGAGNGSFNIGGIISELKAGGGSSVVKSGASTVTLSGSNTYSGGTTLSAGTLTAQDLGSNNFLNALGTGTVTLNGGTLNLRANGTGSSGTIVTGDGATGNNVTVGGDVAINSDRVSGSNTGNTYQFTNLSIGANTLTLNSNNSNKLKFAGTTTLTGNANFNLGNTGADLTLVGAIGDGGSGYGITKLGQPSASLILNGANTYTGATTVGSLMYTSSQTVNNTISVSGANGSIATSSGVFVYGRGSRLLLDYTGVAVGSVDRLSDTTTKGVTLGLGGELSFTGNSTAATNTTETMGQLALNNAYGIVTLTKAGTGLVTITASSFSRGSNRATGLIRGTALGTMGNANTAAKLILTDASGVTLVGVTAANNLGTVDTTKNLKIVPYLVAHNTDTGTGNSFLTYDSTLGFRSLSTANEFNTYSAAAAGDNVLVSAAVASAATKTINSLLINAASANLTGAGGGSNTLTINSGAIFFTPSATGNAATISGFDSITLGDGTWNEGVITVGAASDLTSGATNFGTLTISSPIQGGGAGLTKAGRGTLILAAANTFAGATLVNIGTLSVGHNQALQNSAIDTSGYGQIALT
ncbi:MAG: autotransporter-associated beta strand repeat-containing protein, partial [Verrucomicrobiota bacterium]